MSNHAVQIASAKKLLGELKVFVDRLKAVAPDDSVGEQARHHLAHRLHDLARSADPAAAT